MYWNAMLSALARYDALYRNGLPAHDDLWALVSDVRQSGNALAEWCATRGFFQLWNREYVDALAAALRARGYRHILELGAGRGILARELATRLGPDVQVTAVDERTLDYPTALARVPADAVILPRPPDTRDWARLVRATPCVQAYVMIGPHAVEAAAQPPPGWAAERLAQVDRYSICCLDYGLGRASKTVLCTRLPDVAHASDGAVQ